MLIKTLKLIILSSILSFTNTAHAQQTVTNESKSVEVVFETTMGSFVLQLNPQKAPKTVANFLSYVDQGFYTNTLFHRAIPGFVVQAGGYTTGLKKKKTQAPVINESDNGLKNYRGTISMARTNDPDSATSQFFINVNDNPNLDYHKSTSGYAVFGKISQGIEVVDNIVNQPTSSTGLFQDVPKTDVIILSVKRKNEIEVTTNETDKISAEQKPAPFIAGKHYIVLKNPVATRDKTKIEVVEMFSYGCPHCYEFEPQIKAWAAKQQQDIDFWYFPAVWNKPMKLFAQAFYAANELKALNQIHIPLFFAIVIKQKNLSSEEALADFFVTQGIDKQSFTRAFNSSSVKNRSNQAESRVFKYSPSGVPEVVVNGKYRIDRMRAGGLTEMLAVMDFLIEKERSLLKKQ